MMERFMLLQKMVIYTALRRSKANIYLAFKSEVGIIDMRLI
jgi:hypothetical protein